MKVTKELKERTTPITVNSTRGVYFLIKGDEIVYVGKTTVGLSRIMNHKKDKDYDDVLWIDLDIFTDKDLATTENKYIVKYKPIYNKTHKEFKKKIEPLIEKPIMKHYIVAIASYRPIYNEGGYSRRGDGYENRMSMRNVMAIDEEAAIQLVKDKVFEDKSWRLSVASAVEVLKIKRAIEDVFEDLLP